MEINKSKKKLKYTENEQKKIKKTFRNMFPHSRPVYIVTWNFKKKKRKKRKEKKKKKEKKMAVSFRRLNRRCVVFLFFLAFLLRVCLFVCLFVCVCAVTQRSNLLHSHRFGSFFFSQFVSTFFFFGSRARLFLLSVSLQFLLAFVFCLLGGNKRNDSSSSCVCVCVCLCVFD